MRKLLIPIVGTFVAFTGHAQETVNFDPPTVAPSFQAIETKEVISLDGKLIEDAWSTAPIVKDFFGQNQDREGVIDIKLMCRYYMTIAIFILAFSAGTVWDRKVFACRTMEGILIAMKMTSLV
jgi:hypothetical protein